MWSIEDILCFTVRLEDDEEKRVVYILNVVADSDCSELVQSELAAITMSASSQCKLCYNAV
jgi:hypothetical protein